MNQLVHYFLAFHYRGITIGSAKKILLQTGKYTHKEIDTAAKMAAIELLKAHPKKETKIVEADIETILASRKKAASQTNEANNLNAVFWLGAIAISLVLIALVFLLSIKAL